MHNTDIAFALALAAIGLAPSAAMAQDSENSTATEVAADTELQTGETSVIQENSASIFGQAAVSETTLRAIAGREDTSQVSQANLQAGVSQNSVGDNAVTGAAQIDGNAFQNMSGLSILNVNTGNNVAINAAMNVNISITPAP